jgi:hypothetical protein
MFIRTILRLFVSLLVLACGAIPAWGSSCIATLCSGTVSNGADTADRTTFNTDNSTLTFTNIPFDTETGTYNSGLNAGDAHDPTALLGTSFLGCLSSQSPCLASTSLAVEDASVGANNWDGGTDPVLAVPGTGTAFDTITIALPANVYAFGVDLLYLQTGSSGAPYLISVNGGSNLTGGAPTGLPGSNFFGYSSTTAITSITIYMGGEQSSLGLDNLELGTTADAQTPEAVTFLMIGSGLLMLRFGRRWLPRVG